MGLMRIAVPRLLRRDEKLKVTVNDMCMFTAIKEGSILEGFVVEGDIIVSVNNEDCKNLAQFVSLTKKHARGRLIFTIRREKLEYERAHAKDEIEYVSVLFPAETEKKGLCVSDNLVVTEVRPDSVFDGKLLVGDRIQAAYSDRQKAYVRLHLKVHLRIFIEIAEGDPIQLKVRRRPPEIDSPTIDVNEWKIWKTDVKPDRDHFAVFYRIRDMKDFKRSVEFSLRGEQLIVTPKPDATGPWTNCFSDKDVLTHVNGREAKDLKAVKKTIDSRAMIQSSHDSSVVDAKFRCLLSDQGTLGNKLVS